MAETDIVVVFGGTGFIGRQLVHQLCGNVREVRVVSRTAPARISGHPSVKFVKGDIRDKRRIFEILDNATVVHHLSREEDDAFEEGVQTLAEASLKHGVRRLIFASSSDALYLGDRGTIDERSGPDPLPHLRNPYSQSKSRSEALLLQFHQRNGLPVVITRPALVMGNGGKIAHGGIGAWISPTCCIGWGNGTNLLPFVLVQDVADAHVRAMDVAGIDGRSFNLAGDVFLSAQEYIRIVSDLSLRNFRFFPRNLAVYRAKSELKSLLKGVVTRNAKTSAPSYRNLKSSAMLAQIDNTLAKKLLEWKPNADLQVFVREAIESNLERVDSGDLRRKPTLAQ